MHHRKQTCGGFALLITVVLTAFLVLILVSMASLVRVETQVASNTQHLEVARQNALVGLQVALGQLQKYAGPDQRVTARADITATATNPYYTGVWDAGAAATAAGDVRTRTAAEENAGRLNPLAPSVWLVSGNEANPILINQATPTTNMREPVTLVKATGAGTSGQVVVPKVEITSDQVPGYSGQQPVGNYAYWVGDEGVKAKLNVVDPYTPRPAIANADAFTPTNLQSYYRGVSAQRFGVEAVEDAPSLADLATDDPRRLAVHYNPTADTEDSATLLRNLNNIHHYTAASLAGVDRATLSARFHDLTAYSNGLLTNTAKGGLRQDLSWHFAQPDATDGLDQTSLLYLTEQNFYNPLKPYKDGIPNSINPKWQALKAFYNMPVVNDSTSVVLPDEANTTNPILPILIQARFFFGCSSDPTGTYLDTRVAFVLANPYNVTLNVNPVRFKFKLRNPGKIKIIVKPGTQAEVETHLMGGTFLTPYFSIAPGKVKVFSLAANTAQGTPDALLMDGLNINNAVRFQLSPTPFTPSVTNKWKLNFKLPPAHTPNDWEYMLYATDKFAEDAALASNPSAPEKAEERAALYFSGYIRLHSGMLTPPSGHPDRSVTGSSNPWVANGYITTLKMSSEINVNTTEQIRWLQDFNVRTSRHMRPHTLHDNPLYVTLYWPQTTTANNFSDGLAADEVPWGTAVSDGVGKTPVILYNLPRTPSGAPPGWPSLLSLGQLQHANLSTRTWQPSYPIGNSYASLFTQRDKTVTTLGVAVYRDNLYYDLSYLLNEALWDGYFFSSIPQTAGIFNSDTDILPNSRYYPRTRADGLRPTQGELSSGSSAAASHLFVNGAFNINSTSVQAWRALFTSFRGLDQNGESNLSGPFPRSPYQSGGSAGAQAVGNDNAWSGFRNLSNAEINNLATQMVNQVRLRGPFRSLGDFVNRRLMSSSADSNNLGLRGALQAAIDAAGLNAGFNDNVNSSAYSGFSHLSSSNVVGSRSVGAPGWLLQGDLLQGLGPILSARSDTFVIRAYGDSADPVSTANGTNPPRAYCEAVVQRVHDYVDTGNAVDAATTTLNATNVKFGRRFVITQFRWLTESDL